MAKTKAALPTMIAMKPTLCVIIGARIQMAAKIENKILPMTFLFELIKMIIGIPILTKTKGIKRGKCMRRRIHPTILPTRSRMKIQGS